MPKSGVLNIYKPRGITSNAVVTRIKRLTGEKTGHTGTLDPDAEGVLPICIGKATKAAGMLTDSDKAYRAGIRLGVVTDTQDMTGTVLETSDANISAEEFEAAVNSFVGEISQIPPMYSAIKMNGQPLYKLARKGLEVERKPRNIKIYEIKILSFDGSKGEIEVYCSKGTYIRTLCDDIGKKLGCGAAMDGLIRIKSGGFDVKDSAMLEEIEKNPDRLNEILIPTDKLFPYKKLSLKGSAAKAVLNGNPVLCEGLEKGEKYRLYSPSGEFLCVSVYTGNMLKMEKSFY